jgi:hypothetical protein
MLKVVTEAEAEAEVAEAAKQRIAGHIERRVAASAARERMLEAAQVYAEVLQQMWYCDLGALADETFTAEQLAGYLERDYGRWRDAWEAASAEYRRLSDEDAGEVELAQAE